MITIKLQRGYWTLCHEDQGLMSFTSRAAAEAAQRGLEEALQIQVDEMVDEAFAFAAFAQAQHLARVIA